MAQNKCSVRNRWRYYYTKQLAFSGLFKVKFELLLNTNGIVQDGDGYALRSCPFIIRE